MGPSVPAISFWVLLLFSVAVKSSSLTPPVLPLIVRNPYLSTWLGNARGKPWEKWPIFWTGEEIGLSVQAFVRGSKSVYPLLGRPQDSLDADNKDKGYSIAYPVYEGAQYDASVTNLTYRINPIGSSSSRPVTVVLSFLSPVTPTSLSRQSLPASYLAVFVEGGFDIDIYVDVNGQWASGSRDSKIQWELTSGDRGENRIRTSWSVKRTDELLFTEINDRAEWGTFYFSGPPDAHSRCGHSALLRKEFASSGILAGEVDNQFRGIMDQEPVFAFSVSFNLTGSAGREQQEAIFTLAHVQDPVVQYASARGLSLMRPLWKSWFRGDGEMLDYHYADFRKAWKLAQAYSDQLAKDAYKSGSESYVDIVALSARQVIGATTFSGTSEAPLLFLKEISSNGNCQTVDVIFPAFPFFLYTNSLWLAYLLEPLLEHQRSGQYPNHYSMHDLGSHFPNMTGHPDGRDEYMPLEECGDMLIMTLALVNSIWYGSGHEPSYQWSLADLQSHPVDDDGGRGVFPVRATEAVDGLDRLDDGWKGDAEGLKQAQAWLRRSYPLLKQWTRYLVEFALEPHNQLSTDDFAGWLALQTNLALKGIVGIKAMSELANVLGEEADYVYYKRISDCYIERWLELAMSRDGTHAKLAYDWYGSWTTLYSLFADSVLCFHPSSFSPSRSRSSSPYPSSSSASDSNTNTNANIKIQPNQFRLQQQKQQQQPMLRLDNGNNSPPSQGGADPSSQLRGMKGRKAIEHDFIPDRIYSTQSKWYASVMQKYGLPLDNRHLYAKSDWEFEVAAVAEPSVRAEILRRVATWLDETVADRAFPDLYLTEADGGFPGPNFFARPVVGAHFAFLTLERACGRRPKPV